MEFDLEDPLTGVAAAAWEDEEEKGEVGLCPADSAAALFAAEPDHVCAAGKLGEDAALRRDAVAALLQAQVGCSVDPFVVYLATNYVDRFLSREAIPGDKPWIARLLAISCLSLACKMKKVDFSIADFQAEEGFIYDGQTIRRMELLVLRALNWRMRSITPFSFLRFFLALFRPADPPLLAALKSRASEIVFRSQNGETNQQNSSLFASVIETLSRSLIAEIKLLGCKPSAVAASALLTASHELFPVQFPTFRDAISLCSYLNKEELWECSVTMGELAAMDGCDGALAASSCCDTPVTVLRRYHHRNCSSSESESTAFAGGATAAADRDLKKRRIGGVTGEYCSVFLRPPADKI
ncbi:hypothetical protein Taro_024907 [Colocasia esculenta]|uniref:Cyclin-D6-1 n=1 Tax=Colocasia esculenta TaxID=4460 RepID=A0A843V1Q0_COLES|nr:hypothetical protein [Colocasia esculenta]